jgi:DNA-directed RNA polymerase subunit E'
VGWREPQHSITAEDLDKAVLEILRRELEGKVDEELGFIIAVIEAKFVDEWIVPPLSGDPDIYYPVRYKVLTFRPILHEVVKGIVTKVESGSLFVRLGPRMAEGIVPRQQVMDTDVTLTPDRRGFQSPSGDKVVMQGDVVKARITSYAKTTGRVAYVMKIGLTMRQSYLGKDEWWEEKAKEAKAKA